VPENVEQLEHRLKTSPSSDSRQVRFSNRVWIWLIVESHTVRTDDYKAWALGTSRRDL
jgi:hypothetical protein